STARARSESVACSASCRGSVGKDVLLGPAGEIQPRAFGQEAETGFGQVQSPLPDQARCQRLSDLVQVENVRSSIFHLRLAQLGRAPVARLLGLGDVDTQEFLAELPQPVPVAGGA